MHEQPKYNVLMLGWEFYPVFAGGMGVVTSEIVQGLTEANIGVHFVIPRLPQKIELNKVRMTAAADYKASKQTIEKINIIGKNLTKTYVDTIIMPYGNSQINSKYNFTEAVKSVTNAGNEVDQNIDHNFGGGLYHSDMVREIKMFENKIIQIALESNFDLIHAHDWMTFKAAIMAKEISGKPVILHVHATEYDRSGDFPDVMKLNIEKECLEQADFVIAVSHKTKQDLITKYGIDANKIEVIHNSVNFSQPHMRSILSKEDKIVMFLGRITMQKGPEYFIYAAAKVLKYAPHTIFVMAGDGDMLPKCIELVNELNIEKNFIFTGFLTGNKKERLYASADLFVMPSVSEPFGIVPLEAIKSGTPAIISKTSGAAEIIFDAIKVDFWDVDKLADSIHASLKYSSLHEELLERQYHDITELNWNHQIDVMIKLYEMATQPH